MLSKAVKIILGALFILVGLWVIVMWWGDVLALIRGGLGFVLILAGLICFAVLD